MIHICLRPIELPRHRPMDWLHWLIPPLSELRRLFLVTDQISDNVLIRKQIWHAQVFVVGQHLYAFFVSPFLSRLSTDLALPIIFNCKVVT